MPKKKKGSNGALDALRKRVAARAELKELSEGYDLSCPTGDPAHEIANIEYLLEYGEVPTFCWGEGEDGELCREPIGLGAWEEVSLYDGGRLIRGHNRLGFREGQFEYDARCAAKLLVDAGLLTYDAVITHMEAGTLEGRYGTQIRRFKAEHPEWRQVLKRRKGGVQPPVSPQPSTTVVVNGGSMVGVAIGLGASARAASGSPDLVGRGYDLSTPSGRLDALCSLIPSQFALVSARLGIPSAILPNGSQAQRAVAVLDWIEFRNRTEDLKTEIRRAYGW